MAFRKLRFEKYQSYESRQSTLHAVSVVDDQTEAETLFLLTQMNLLMDAAHLSKLLIISELSCARNATVESTA
jgi:hypothetical protein